MSLKLQASTLAQLTGATNQLTRDAAVNRSICFLSTILISFPDRCCIEVSPTSRSSSIDGRTDRVRRCSTSVESSQPMRVECADGEFRGNRTSAMNYGHFSFKAINGPLQERGAALNLDYNRANTFPADYDTDLESDWTNESESPGRHESAAMLDRSDFRIICRWKRFFLGNHSERSKQILSETKCRNGEVDSPKTFVRSLL